LLAGRREVPAGEVARTDVADAALLDEGVERLPQFVPGAVTVDVVHLVELDVLGPQALEAAEAVLADLVGREAARVGVGLGAAAVALDGVEDLGGQHYGLASALPQGEPVADDLLGAARLDRPPVDVGRVEEVDAELQGAIHDREGVGLAGVPAEVHGAEAQLAHQQPVATESLRLDAHASLLMIESLTTRRAVLIYSAHHLNKCEEQMSSDASPQHMRFLHTVASLYHLEGKTQMDIADLLSVSRSKVLRALQEARAQGIVQITVVDPSETNASLAAELESRLGLHKAI